MTFAHQPKCVFKAADGKNFTYTGSIIEEFDTNEVVVKRKKLFACLPDAPVREPTVTLSTLLGQLSRKYKVNDEKESF
jgi:hypothetical protein